MPTLLELVGLDAAERKRRLQFLEFGDDDRRRLAEIAPFIESIADGMVEVFYERILSFPETAPFLVDADVVKRVKRAQRAHFIQLFTGPYDAEYFESRLRVGFAHARIQLPPQLYLGGYLIQIHFVRESLSGRFPDGAAALERCLRSFDKVIMLDIALATDAYIYGGFVERSAADMRAYEAALAQEALELNIKEEEKREELLRMIVHDIRSPVAAMMATARAAMRRYREFSEPPGKQFALVEATGQNVLQIIDNMVSHARAPLGELPMVVEPFDVAEVVSACVAQLLPFAQQTGHALTVLRLDPAPSTRLDKVLVRRVISNLLVNACRHTRAGCHIEVECESGDGECRVTVGDDGPGLPSAVRKALVEGSMEPRATGAFVDSGLGLPFCRLACERMGGHIELSSRDPRGARLVVHLPA